MDAARQHWTFISYSRHDKGFALELARELKSAGYLVWLDQLDIPTGARWDEEVEKALHECDVFLIILTQASISSENVKDEIGYAIDRGKRILPILMEECEVPLRLRRFQYVDFTKLEFSEGVKRAEQLLQSFLNKPSIPVAESNRVVEVQKNQKIKTRSTSLPKERPYRRRWIFGRAGILLLTAFVGALCALAAVIMFRDSIFPAANAPQSQHPPSATQIQKAKSTNTSTQKATLTKVPTATSTNTRKPIATLTRVPKATATGIRQLVIVATLSLFQPSATLIKIEKVGDCQWDIYIQLKGFRPNSHIKVTSKSQLHSCSTGEIHDSYWEQDYSDITDSTGSLVVSYAQGDFGTYNYTCTDDIGNSASVVFSYSAQ